MQSTPRTPGVSQYTLTVQRDISYQLHFAKTVAGLGVGSAGEWLADPTLERARAIRSVRHRQARLWPGAAKRPVGSE